MKRHFQIGKLTNANLSKLLHILTNKDKSNKNVYRYNLPKSNDMNLPLLQRVRK